MSPESYRIPPRLDPDDERKPKHDQRPWDVTIIVGVLWVLAAAHLLIAWRLGGSATRDLTTPWLVLIFAPLVIYAERFS